MKDRKPSWVRAFFTPKAFIGYMIIVYKPIFNLISFLGDVEFVATYWSAINQFLETGFGIFTSIAVGCLIIAWAVGSKMDEQKNMESGGQSPPGQSKLPQSSYSSLPSSANSEKPDYSIWDARDWVTLLEASSLWLDRTPVIHSSQLPIDELSVYSMLVEAVEENELNAFRRGLNGRYAVRSPEQGDKIRKEDLKNFILKKRIKKPPFLFPEKRLSGRN